MQPVPPSARRRVSPPISIIMSITIITITITIPTASPPNLSASA
jgi:hypothetical protein